MDTVSTLDLHNEVYGDQAKLIFGKSYGQAVDDAVLKHLAAGKATTPASARSEVARATRSLSSQHLAACDQLALHNDKEIESFESQLLSTPLAGYLGEHVGFVSSDYGKRQSFTL